MQSQEWKFPSSTWTTKSSSLWAGGEKDLIITCTGWWITHMLLLILPAAPNVLHKSPINDRDACRSQMAILSLIILHFRFTLESHSEFLSKKIEEINKRGSRSEFIPSQLKFFLSKPAAHFNLPSHYSKWKRKLEPGAFIFEQREERQIMNVQNVISITLPLFFY